MPKPIAEAQYESLIQMVGLYPEGATLADLRSRLTPPPDERIVLFHLGVLEQRHRLTRVRDGRKFRWFLQHAPIPPVAPASGPAPAPVDPALPAGPAADVPLIVPAAKPEAAPTRGDTVPASPAPVGPGPHSQPGTPVPATVHAPVPRPIAPIPQPNPKHGPAPAAAPAPGTPRPAAKPSAPPPPLPTSDLGKVVTTLVREVTTNLPQTVQRPIGGGARPVTDRATALLQNAALELGQALAESASSRGGPRWSLHWVLGIGSMVLGVIVMLGQNVGWGAATALVAVTVGGVLWYRSRAGAVAPAVPPVVPPASAPTSAKPGSQTLDATRASSVEPVLRTGPSGSRRRAALVIGAITLVLVGGTLTYQHYVSRPSKAVIGTYLTTALAPLPLQVTFLDVTVAQTTAISTALAYDARFETTEPLYTRVDTATYLRTHAPAEFAALAAADEILAGPDGERIKAEMLKAETLKGTGDSAAADPSASRRFSMSASTDVVLVTTSSPPGTSATAAGQLLAFRVDGTWKFSGDPVRLTPPGPAGEPRPRGTAVFAVDHPADAAQFRAWLAGPVSLAAQVQAAANTLAAARERERQQRTAAFAETLCTGTLFRGELPPSASRTTMPFVLQFYSVSGPEVSALLRNDGGWWDARTFAGTWTVASSGDEAVVTLRSRSDEAVASAGPWLEDRGDLELVLRVRQDGTGTITPGSGAIVRIDRAQAAAVKAELNAPVQPLLAATAPDRWYRGTVTSPLRTAPEAVLLHFTDQRMDGARLEAVLESGTIQGLRRPFRGGVIGNRYRAGSAPIRLESRDGEIAPFAEPGSILRLATGENGTVLNLRIEGERLVGEGSGYTYRFEPITVLPPRLPANAAGTVPAYQPPMPSNAVTPAPARGSELPALPQRSGAYVLAAGQWKPLPRNESRILPLLPGVTAGDGELLFYGNDRLPLASAGEVVLAYLGNLAGPTNEELKDNPKLQQAEPLEVGALTVERGIVRDAVVYALAPGWWSLGPGRVATRLARPDFNACIARCRLAAGRYTLFAPKEYFEFAVE